MRGCSADVVQGDISAPSSPPCARCRRESRECIFAPSRRGGNNAKRKRDDHEPSSSQHNSFGDPKSSSAPWYDNRAPSNDPSPTIPGPSPGTSSSLPRQTTYQYDVPTGASMSSGKSYEDSPTSSLDKRSKLPRPEASSILQAGMQNESDALQILAIAAGRPSTEESRRRRPTFSSGAVTPARAREQPARIEDFALVKLGIVDGEQVWKLVNAFFRYYHHLVVSPLPTAWPKS